MPDLIEELSWRGLVHQTTDPAGLAALLASRRRTGYIGFDPTASSLHVGSLQMVVLLRHLEMAGHRPVALVGGGTGMIGDPSFKSAERVLLDADALAANREGIRSQLATFLDFGAGGAVLVDNAEWLGEARLLEFLRDVGKLFSVNEMVRKESVRSRLDGRESFLSFTEFSYMLLQAWDFVELFDRYGCCLQMGGSDQWGNITEGVDLIRRLRQGKAFGLTSPLLTKADGTKFGKTESGNVWLDPTRTSPYSFYQFWFRTADADVMDLLRRLTFLSRDEIQSLEEAVRSDPGRRAAQQALAREVTAMVHGPDELRRVEAAARVLFTEEIATLDPDTLAAVLADAPATSLPAREVDEGLSLVDALIRAGLSASKGAARRDIAGGGIYLNGVRQGVDRPLVPEDALGGRYMVLRRGKATQHVLVCEPGSAGPTQALP